MALGVGNWLNIMVKCSATTFDTQACCCSCSRLDACRVQRWLQALSSAWTVTSMLVLYLLATLEKKLIALHKMNL